MFGRRAPCLARLPEAGAERDVRDGVLVEQRVRVHAARPADARGRVDERHLAEPVGVPVGVDVRREELAVVLVVGFEPHEPTAAELARDALDRPPAEVERPRAAEGALRSRRIGAREVLFRRDVPGEQKALRVLLLAAEPVRAGREPDGEVRAGTAQLDSLELELAERLRPRGERVDVSRPALVAGRVVGSEPAEPEQLLEELPLRRRWVEIGEDLRRPERRRPAHSDPAACTAHDRPYVPVHPFEAGVTSPRRSARRGGRRRRRGRPRRGS